MESSPTLDPILTTLRDERKRRGLSLEEVGLMLGRSSYQSVWQWEHGINDIKLANLRAWAKALGYDVVLTPRAQRRS